MRISKLDGLRGIFSFMIVLHHYKKEFLPEWLYNCFLIRQSFLFVDFFFVLSGFVISYNYNSFTNFKEFIIFIKKRLIRLYPLLFFSSLLMLFYVLFSKFVFLSFFPKFLERDGIDSYHAFLLTLDSLLFTNSTPILGTSLGLNYPSWSISSEMISYIVFGILTLYLFKKLRVFTFIIIMITSLIILNYRGDFFSMGGYGFLRGLVCFNIGYFVWEFSKFEIKLFNKIEYFIPVMLLVLFYYLDYLYKKSDESVFGMVIIPVFFGLSIFTLLKTDGEFSRLLNTKLFQYFGRISYSIYLNHPILLIIIVKPVFRIFKIEQTLFNQFFVLLILIFVLIMYSHFTYKYIELKGSLLLKKILFRTTNLK